MLNSMPAHQLSVSYTLRLAFTRDAFAPDNQTLADAMPAGSGSAQALVYLDRSVAAADPALAQRISRWFHLHQGAVPRLAALPELLDGGESAKDGWPLVERIGRTCHDLGIDRHSYVVVIGGGAVLDAVGFAAALVHRGIRLVRLPTTTLAQADAGLGVKNAVNAFGAKNFLGTFQPPWAVVNDLRFLETLDDRAWRAGIAEAVKVAVIKDAGFLGTLTGLVDRLRERDLDAMEQAVRRCADLHLDHILTSGDPFEQGSSRPLDFGHWSAHQLELLTRHRLSHGEAVAIGVALDLCYAVDAGWIATVDADTAIGVLRNLGFRLWDEALDLRGASDRRRVLDGLDAFREHLGGSLTLAMPDGLGRRQDIHEIDPARMERAFADVRRRARATSGTPVT